MNNDIIFLRLYIWRNGCFSLTGSYKLFYSCWFIGALWTRCLYTLLFRTFRALPPGWGDHMLHITYDSAGSIDHDFQCESFHATLNDSCLQDVPLTVGHFWPRLKTVPQGLSPNARRCIVLWSYIYWTRNAGTSQVTLGPAKYDYQSMSTWRLLRRLKQGPANTSQYTNIAYREGYHYLEITHDEYPSTVHSAGSLKKK